ncbi:MAG: hypothetical protein WBM53_04560 [Maribacter sp.]
MKIKNIISGILLLIPIAIMAQDLNDSSAETLDSLIGNWTIDLRPTPESDGYFQSFVVTPKGEKSFTGTFYGSEINNALVNRNWPKIYFAFSTSDQSNDYYHSGYLENGKLYGITYCPSREFTAPWTGVKE